MSSPKHRQRTSNTSTSSSHAKRQEAISLVRTRKPSISQLCLPNKRVESPSSATLFFGPAIRRSEASATPARPRPATVIALDSPVNASSTPAHVRPLPVFGHQGSASRHSYAGPDSSLFCGTGKSGWAFPSSPSVQTSFTPLREAEMGEISDEDESDFAPAEVDIPALDDKSAEDLFFSSSFVHSRDIGPDTSFGWDSTPVVSSLTVNVTQSTPSPRSKAAPVRSKLEKKYRPRDSGIVLSEDEGNGTGPNILPDFVPPAPRHRYTIGRSESVNLSMPRASTSVSTLGSGSSDQELVTPIFGPSPSVGWPHLTSSSSNASSLGTVDVNAVDAFILRTLMQAARRGEHVHPGNSDGGGIRPPGTPQKRAKTAVVLGGARLWQSAVASKIGFDFGNDDDADDNEDGCTKRLTDNGRSKKNKKAPRKSLPAAFPLLSKTTRGRGRVAGAGDSDEELGQSDASPTERKASYDGLGLGRPSVTKVGGTGWLLRRSSSGAISSTTSGSGSVSGDRSPTGTTGITRRVFHFCFYFDLAYLMIFALSDDRLAASAPANPPPVLPTKVEHPEPPSAEPNGVEFLRGVYSEYARLTHAAPSNTAAPPTSLWTRATCTRGLCA
jgi:mitosis inhibitor protein kinase SWE1